jgi:hypothetical protein
MMDWVARHKWWLVVGAVVVFGLLLWIGSETVSLPGAGGNDAS